MMYTTRVFNSLVGAWYENPRYINNKGGTRSSKTYSALQLLSLVMEASRTKKVLSIVGETLPFLKRGAIRDFRNILEGENKWSDAGWSKSENIYQFPNRSIIEFFSADSPDRVLGPARDYLFVNEGINIPYDTARQLFVRTRGAIIVDYNPASAFWMQEHYEPRKNCITINSTYKDNRFLTPEQVEEIESNRDDENWWRVYGLGLEGHLEGVIYTFEQVDELPSDGVDFYGMDFGFTNDPTAIVHIKADTGRKTLYLDEVCYRTRMTNGDIVDVLKREGVPMRTTPVYADCAEPKSIAEIGNAGYNVKPCDKSAPVKSDKMKFQIDWMRGWKMCVTKRSTNLIKELRNYTWAKDRDGNSLNTPIDKWNHALDAARYGCWTHLAENANKGKYLVYG